MPFVFDDESKPGSSGFVFDDEKAPKKNSGFIENLKNYGLSTATAIGEGVGQLEAGAGTFLQAPLANLSSGIYGANAAVDRTLTGLTNYLSPGLATLNPETQELARSTAANAAQQRAENNASPYNLLAKVGTGLEWAGRGLAKENEDFDKANNPELVRQQQKMAQAEGFVDNIKAGIDNPLALSHTLAQSVPAMVLGAGAGRMVATSALAGAEVAGAGAAAKAAAAGADMAGQKLAAQAAIKAVQDSAVARASMVGMGSEAGTAGLQDREGMHQQVMGTPLDKLTASPRFNELIAQTKDPIKAREALANELADQVPGLAFAGTAAGTKITNRMFGGDATAKSLAGVEKMGVREFGKRVAADTAEEVVQGIPEDAAQFAAGVQADPSKKYDLGGAIAQNAIGGFAMGSGGHGFAAAHENYQALKGKSATPESLSGEPSKKQQDTPLAAVIAAQEATNSIAKAPDTTAAEKALLTPVALTALDRVNEIDQSTAALSARAEELNRPDSGYGPMFDQERAELATQKQTLEDERSVLAKDWPKAVTGMPSSFTTEAGARVEAQYALMDAQDLITSHDEGLRKNPLYPPELQPRERERAASEIQVASINQKLDPAKLGWSADAATGAPIVGADGLVESGNARTIALKRVYQNGDGKGDDGRGSKAHLYREFLKDNAAQFGITPESVDGMTKPVLVRVRTTPVNRAEFARQANASTVAVMSPSEQAKSDSNRIDSMEDLAPDDSGDFSNAASRPFVRRFMARLPITEQAGMIDANGDLSTTGYARVRNAVLAKAYGDSPVLARMTESMDDNLRNVSKAMMMAAPKVAQMRSAVSAGNRFDADITPDLMAAAEELSRLKDDGGSVQDALAQTDLMGDQRSPEASQLLQFLSDNMRRPRKMADFIGAYMDALDAAGDPNQGSLLGETQAPAKKDLLTAAEKATKNEVQDGGSKGAGTAQKAGDQTQRQSEDAQGGSNGAQANGVSNGPGKNTDTSGQSGQGWVVAGFGEIVAQDLEDGKGNASLSRGEGATGLPATQVTSITNTIKSRWANAPEIIVAANMADTLIPQAVRDYDQKQKSLGATGEPEGFIHKGKVYLVADQLATSSDVIRVLFHESLGHIGLRGVFGDSLKPILQQIVMVRRADVAAKAKHYGLDMSKEADRLVAAEEVLAELAQTKPEIGFVKRAIAAIRNWLRANVPGFSNMKLMDEDIIQQFILPARAFVEKGKPKEGKSNAILESIAKRESNLLDLLACLA